MGLILKGFGIGKTILTKGLGLTLKRTTDSFDPSEIIYSNKIPSPLVIIEAVKLEMEIITGGKKLKPELAETINIILPSVMNAKKLEIEIIKTESLENINLEYIKTIDNPKLQSVFSFKYDKDNIKKVLNLHQMLYNTIIEVKKVIENSEQVIESKLTSEPQIKGK